MYLYTGASPSKISVYAVALGGFAALAQAADLDDRLKDPLPDGPITWQGITLYGTVDVAAAYQTHGAKLSGFAAAPLNYMMFGAAPNNKSISTFTSNAMEQAIRAAAVRHLTAQSMAV